MPNITVHVDREIYNAGRAYAKKHGTSISALVADFLATLQKQSRRHPRRGPRSLVKTHSELLSLSPAQVNPEPRTVWEFSKVVNALLNSTQPNHNQ